MATSLEVEQRIYDDVYRQEDRALVSKTRMQMIWVPRGGTNYKQQSTQGSSTLAIFARGR